MTMAKSKRTRIDKLYLNEISGVDVPAQAGACVVIIKRADTDIVKGAFVNALKIVEEERADSNWKAAGPAGSIIDRLSETSSALHRAIEAVVVIEGDASALQARVSLIIAEYINSIEDVLSQISTLISKGVIKMNADDIGKSVLSALEKHTGEDGKVDADKVVEDVKASAESTESADDELTRLRKMVDLSAEHRAYVDSVQKSAAYSDAQKAELIGKFLSDDTTDEARDEVIKAANQMDDVYKAADGKEYRKSELGGAYDLVVGQAKALDDMKKNLDVINAEKRDAELIAKSREEFPDLPGDDAAHLALQKSLEGMSDEARGEVVTMLKSKSDANGQMFTEVGSSTGGVQIRKGETEADAKLNAAANDLVRKSAEDGEKITYAEAFTRVCDTPEGERLYEESRAQRH